MKKKQKSEKKKKQHISVTLFFTFTTFFILILTILLVATVIYELIRINALTMFKNKFPSLGSFLGFLFITSILVGSIVTFIINRAPLKPFEELIKQINRLSEGDYSTRLNFGKFFGKQPGMEELKDSFNKLATELESTEMLRSDFINNFSHEFKTPIVSIAGFAKLLRRGTVSEKHREEYLKIIEEESLRLANMATNILNLTKIENQSILSDVTTFNLSEQMRASILLFEDKWTDKNIDLNVDFDEYNIEANEELLKQVWINLIDNAIKFSPEYGVIKIEISERGEYIEVDVANTGEPIPEEQCHKIFNKFYQADESHSTEGNGIGLAVVKGVTALHNGSVKVRSTENLTVFTVRLPKHRN